MPKKKMIPIPASKKRPLEDARVIAAASPDERLEVTLRLRPRIPLPQRPEMLKRGAVWPRITHKEYERTYGAHPKDIASVRKFARANNLAIVRESPARRSVMLSGTVADFNPAFQVALKTYEYPGGTYRGRTGPVRIPVGLSPVVEGVFGLDNRQVAKRHHSINPQAARKADGARPFSAVEVAKLYDFPTDVDGSGQAIGIIELGGGYRPQDIEDYFGRLHLPRPRVVPVGVNGATNAPFAGGQPNAADPEVAIDIEVAGAIAPGAELVVYFAPDRTSRSFLDAMTKAVHDSQHQLSVISISWDQLELPRDSFQIQFDQVLQAAAMLGITVCVAAGDSGAAGIGPKAWDGKAHVSFPASSPFALACGGTRLIKVARNRIKESIWNQHKADLSSEAGPNGSFGAGGGGVSCAFDLPNYQQTAGVPGSLNPPGYKGRGVPDVAGDADAETGYSITLGGQSHTCGGTSAAAPLWAGLVALINQKLKGRVGFINPQIYDMAADAGAFHDVTDGNNRVSYKGFVDVGYDAGPGWNACGGLGSPDGRMLCRLLRV